MFGLDLPEWQVVTFNWAVVSLVICGVTYYYGGFDKLIAKYRPEPQAVVAKEHAEKVSRKKTKNKPDGRIASGTDSGSAINGGKTASATVAKKMATAFTTGADQKQKVSGEDEEDTSRKANMEFARSLNKAKLGTDFSSSQKNSTKSRPRTVKSKLVDATSSQESAATSSTGQDGDDETSRAASPVVKPTTSEAVPDTISGSDMPEPESPAMRATPPEDIPDITGVKDMLEPPNKTLKTISLVGDFQQVQSKKQKSAAKAPEPAETKKQRQQRRKREEERERMAQSNKEHDAKREQQMRGARIAEGTSNQTKANAFKSPVNAWTSTSKSSQGTDVKQPAPGAALMATVAPLDTFESKPAGNDVNDGAVTAQSMSQVTNGQNDTNGVNELKKELGTQATSALAASQREKAPEAHHSLQRADSWADQMDEEEQVKLAREDSQKWESVVTKKDKKKVRKVDTEASGDSTKRVNGQASQPAGAGKTNGTSSRQQPKPVADNRYGSLVIDSTSNDAEEEAREETWEA
jgi:hypothetical protein